MFSNRRQSLPALFKIHPIFVESMKPKRYLQFNQYLLKDKIGKGSSAKVYICEDTDTGKLYAAKRIKIDKISKGFKLQQLEREIRIMRSLKHENIVSLHEVLQSKEKKSACIILEYADCGSLLNHLTNTMIRSENYIATIFKQVVNGLLYLHNKGIVHQDIKPSNILLFSDGTAKIADFGIGHSFQSADMVVGSPAYQAPEFFGDCDSEDIEEDLPLDPIKEDVWSLGITIFETVFGYLPFRGSNPYEIAKNARTKSLNFPHEISNDLKDLLFGMLEINPENRFTMEEVSHHCFFKKEIYKDQIMIPFLNLQNNLINIEIENIKADICKDEHQFINVDDLPIYPLTLPQRAISRS